METAVIVALISSLSSLLVAAGTALWTSKANERQEEWKRDTQKELADQQAAAQVRLAELEHGLRQDAASSERELDAENVLTRYREPLVAASYDLQRRLYNIIQRGFLDVFMKPGNPRAEEAVDTTLYRVGQYFGWTEVLRLDIQFLKFREADVTRAVAERQAEIAHTFASDSYGHDFMLWQDEQRAIGELMIVRENGSLGCRGYASFQEQRRAGQWSRLGRFEEALRCGKAPTERRLKNVQHHLCELVELLDKDELLYDRSNLKRASGRRLRRATVIKKSQAP